MKGSHIVVTSALVLALLAAAGCKREESTTAPAPAPAPSSTTPEPPNPPRVTGVEPAPPAAPAEAGPAERAGRAIGEKLDDATITAKVKTALLQAPDVKGSSINVTTDRMVVQLSGFVATQAEIERAMQIARGVRGVKEVHNKMSLRSGN